MDDPWHTSTGTYDDQWHGGGGMMDRDGGGAFFVVGVLILVLLAVALVAVLSTLLLRGHTLPPRAVAPLQGDAARQVLDGRLARGEVSAEEYQSVRRLLDDE